MKAFFIVIFCVLSFFAYSQNNNVAINNDGSAPNPSAILDVNSPDKGVLLPRTDTSGITSPVKSMMIYDTLSNCFMYYSGVQWLSILYEGTYQFYFADKDGDGSGYPFNVIYAPSPPEFYVANNKDCDDTNSTVNHTADEICDFIDNDAMEK